jgi:MFS transporter, Spinster family, sphingosine-1-phosphate transporter
LGRSRSLLGHLFSEPLLEGEPGLSNTQLGLLGSSFQWVYAALVPVSGLPGDSANRKGIICAALPLWSATTAASGLDTRFAMSGCAPLSAVGPAARIGVTGAAEARDARRDAKRTSLLARTCGSNSIRTPVA